MKVLVLGGNGFIGSHVVDELLRREHSVRVFDVSEEKFRLALPQVEYFFGDFKDSVLIEQALVGVDAVFHLVSTTVPGTGNLDPQKDVQENLVGTLHLLDAMKRQCVKRIIYLSSGGTVYGIPELTPIPETHPLRPINSYGIVKVAIENYLEMYQRSFEFSPIIIRASNPYGPRQAHTGVQGVVATFLNQIKNNQKVAIWGDGTIVRDYVDVRDLAEFCVMAGTSIMEGVYNAGSGVGTSLNDLVEHLAKITGRDVIRDLKPARAVDIPVSILDCSAAERDFGWKATRNLDVGLESAWKWISAL